MKDRGDYERAEALYEESLTLRRKIEDLFGVAESLGRLAELQRLQRQPDQATSRYRESLQLRRDIGDKGGLAECLEGLAYLASLATWAPVHRQPTKIELSGRPRRKSIEMAVRFGCHRHEFQVYLGNVG